MYIGLCPLVSNLTYALLASRRFWGPLRAAE